MVFPYNKVLLCVFPRLCLRNVEWACRRVCAVGRPPVSSSSHAALSKKMTTPCHQSVVHTLWSTHLVLHLGHLRRHRHLLPRGRLVGDGRGHGGRRLGLRLGLGDHRHCGPRLCNRHGHALVSVAVRIGDRLLELLLHSLRWSCCTLRQALAV